MAIRHGLDLAGLKLGLEDWRLIPPAQRFRLLELDRQDARAIGRFREAVLRVTAENGIPAPQEIQPADRSAWSAGAAVPAEIVAAIGRTGDMGASGDWERISGAWPGLPELSRYALLKLARSRREPEGLARAVREFLTAPA